MNDTNSGNHLSTMLSNPTPHRVEPTTINIMAPLWVNNLRTFRERLRVLKGLGVNGIFVDVWWGKIEEKEGVYDWDHYLQLFTAIIDAGLKIVVGFSFHACGGNIGDTVNIPLPPWIWDRMPKGSKFKSEHGNECEEYVSFWATRYVVPYYRRFMERFADEFRDMAPHISEIVIGCGPCGEARFPSYGPHDGAVAAYPTRGALQCYSDQAVEDFRLWTLRRSHHNLGRIANAWGKSIPREQDITPPKSAEAFFSTGEYLTPYGVDVLTWYQGVLLGHVKTLMGTALKVFQRQPYANIALAMKIPGIHWGAGSRHGKKVTFAKRWPEICSGLIAPNADADGGLFDPETGMGYGPLVKMVARLTNGKRPVVLDYTCVDKPDNGDPGADSLAESLTGWVAAECQRQGLICGAENAMADSLREPACRKRLADWLLEGGFTRLTILRMEDFFVGADAPTVRQWLKHTTGRIAELESRTHSHNGHAVSSSEAAKPPVPRM